MEIKLLTESFRWSGGGGTPELDRQVQSTLILSCCRIFCSLRKHSFLLALRRWGRFEQKRMFSQARYFEVWNFPFQEFSWVGNLVSFFGSFTYVGMYLKIVVATLQQRACTCQRRSSRIPDEEKINSYGTINKQPQTFNFLLFFFFSCYIIKSI